MYTRRLASLSCEFRDFRLLPVLVSTTMIHVRLGDLFFFLRSWRERGVRMATPRCEVHVLDRVQRSNRGHAAGRS